MHAAAMQMTYEHARSLLDAGAVPQAIMGGRAGVSCIKRLPGGAFEPADRGNAALLLPLTAQGALVDVLAWVRQDGWLGRLTGRGWALGADNAGPNRLTVALRIVRTVPDWLRDPFCALMIVDERRVRSELSGVSRMAVADRGYARKLERLLREPVWRGRVDVRPGHS